MEPGVRSGAAEQRHERARRLLDPAKPIACFVEPECDPHGQIVSGAVVLLTNRECPWRCIYCDLWKNTLLEPVPPGAIASQLDAALNQLGGSVEGCGWIKLYNAGSFFDPGSIPPADYPSIAARLGRFSRVIVECHPSLISEAVLRFRDLIAPRQLEIAMGLETVNEKVLARLNKAMTLAQFSGAAGWLRRHQVDLRAFTLLQPPFLTDPTEALAWSTRALHFAFDCGAGATVVIPTRGGTDPMTALAREGQFVSPALATLETAVEEGCRLGRGRVFAELWELEQFSKCQHCFAPRQNRLREINLRQIIPPPLRCQACEVGVNP